MNANAVFCSLRTLLELPSVGHMGRQGAEVARYNVGFLTILGGALVHGCSRIIAESLDFLKSSYPGKCTPCALCRNAP